RTVAVGGVVPYPDGRAVHFQRVVDLLEVVFHSVAEWRRGIGNRGVGDGTGYLLGAGAGSGGGHRLVPDLVDARLAVGFAERLVAEVDTRRDEAADDTAAPTSR